ncbi:L,D-transpeptidase family protein [Lachnospiraceae bacterium LCP25S3_G4]
MRKRLLGVCLTITFLFNMVPNVKANEVGMEPNTEIVQDADIQEDNQLQNDEKIEQTESTEKTETEENIEQSKLDIQEEPQDVSVVVKNGFLIEDGKTYYYIDNVKVIGWKWVETAWYFMDENGVVQSNGWLIDDGKHYYLSETGAMKTDWIWCDNSWYYLGKDGSVKTGWVWTDNHWYFLRGSGTMATGWLWDGFSWYYLNSSGAMCKEWIFTGGYWYYLRNNGSMATGWILWEGKWYYLGTSGNMYQDWNYVDGYKYYFYSNGALCEDVRPYVGGPYWIKVAKQANCVTVYAKDGNNGYIIPVKAMVCSTGNPTPIGTFYSPSKYRWQEMVGGSFAQFCTRITGNFLFHSVPYAKTNNQTLYTNYYNLLGTTTSLGCIRLTTADAYWIYYNCELGTPITIYNSWHPGPFSKPEAPKLPIGQRWDPTDPTL